MPEVETAPMTEIPNEIARRILLPEGHRDEVALHDAYSWLRANAPLAKAELDGYDPFWMVSKHEDIMAIERDPALFSSAGIHTGGQSIRIESQSTDLFNRAMVNDGRLLDSLSVMDPPEHTEIKDIANDWFRPANLAKWEDVVRSLAKEAIKTRLGEGAQEMDFVKDFAVFYPLHVIMSLVGVPAEDEPRMLALTQEFFGPADPDIQNDAPNLSPEAIAKFVMSTLQDFSGYFDGFIEDRRRTPREDLATVVANARDSSGDYYDKKYAFGWFVAIATAGHDTTSSTLAGLIQAMAEHPDQLAAVQSDPTQISNLINEALRWVSPVKHFVRQATQDTQLRGQTIRRGDRLVLLYPSANRDEDIFEDPFAFRFDRRRNRHIAFGYGPHMCIGQHLAKLELRVMLEELLPRITKLETIGEPRYVQSSFVGGLKNLPVRMVLG